MSRNLKVLLNEAASLIDKKYNTQRQLINYFEYIKNNEFELAFESLFELTFEVEDQFEYKFWLSLERIADNMKLSNYEKTIKLKLLDFQLNDL